MFFSSVFQKKLGFWVFLVHPTVTVTVTVCGICATIRIGREMLCLPYAGCLKITIKCQLTYAGFPVCKQSVLFLLVHSCIQPCLDLRWSLHSGGPGDSYKHRLPHDLVYSGALDLGILKTGEFLIPLRTNGYSNCGHRLK